MGAHGFARRFRIALLDGRQDSLVMELSALRSSFTLKIRLRCSRKKTDNRIQKRKNQRISSRFRQRQMEIEIGFHVGVGIVQAAVHHGDGFPHGAQQLFLNARGSQAGNFGLEHQPQLRQIR